MKKTETVTEKFAITETELKLKNCNKTETDTLKISVT